MAVLKTNINVSGFSVKPLTRNVFADKKTT